MPPKDPLSISQESSVCRCCRIPLTNIFFATRRPLSTQNWAHFFLGCFQTHVAVSKFRFRALCLWDCWDEWIFVSMQEQRWLIGYDRPRYCCVQWAFEPFALSRRSFGAWFLTMTGPSKKLKASNCMESASDGSSGSCIRWQLYRFARVWKKRHRVSRLP